MSTMLSIVGARPNFLKLAAMVPPLERSTLEHKIVHVGQHYDADLSQVFFTDLELPTPEHMLNVGSGSHAEQTARAMERLEPVLLKQRPAAALVYGDVNSTVAGALTAAKLQIPVAHIEAGLRSNDRTMPEEINRVVTDHLSSLLFAPSRDAVAHLEREACVGDVHFVGNVLIDTLHRSMSLAYRQHLRCRLNVQPLRYVLVTLHRPHNVDVADTLAEIVHALRDVSIRYPVIFPVHPRTGARLCDAGLDLPSSIMSLAPLRYPEMLNLMLDAGVVVTDSGGMQEETAHLGVPCVTIRPNTERPITCTAGTNRLVAAERDAIVSAIEGAIDSHPIDPAHIELWDGHAGDRIVQILEREFGP